MLEKTLQIIKEVNHPDSVEAMREIAVMLAAVKYFQIVLHRMDRDDKVIQSAIDEAMYLRNFDLARRLKLLLKPVTVPYEEIMI